MYQGTNADWTMIESGARLLEGDRVYSFGQYFPGFDDKLPEPGAPLVGMVAMTSATFPGAPILTRPAFDERLKDSAQTIAEANGILSTTPSAQTDVRIEKIMQMRPATLKREMASLAGRLRTLGKRAALIDCAASAASGSGLM
jgi:hypothetical protein